MPADHLTQRDETLALHSSLTSSLTSCFQAQGLGQEEQDDSRSSRTEPQSKHTQVSEREQPRSTLHSQATEEGPIGTLEGQPEWKEAEGPGKDSVASPTSLSFLQR